VQGIERDQPASQAEFGEQRLGGRDLVGFLVDLAVRQHQRGVGGEHAEQVRGGAIAEPVEAAAQGLAVDRQAAPALAWAACNRLAWRRKAASTVSLSKPCRM
jgi:hypothetical protein